MKTVNMIEVNLFGLVSVILVALTTLVAVWFIGKGLLSYWDNYVADYYQTTLSEVCYRYDGNAKFSDFVYTERDGTYTDMTRFSCDFERE